MSDASRFLPVRQTGIVDVDMNDDHKTQVETLSDFELSEALLSGRRDSSAKPADRSSQLHPDLLFYHARLLDRPR